MVGECKWRNEKTGLEVLQKLREKADIFNSNREQTWFVLFSKSGFTEAVQHEAQRCNDVILIDRAQLMSGTGGKGE